MKRITMLLLACCVVALSGCSDFFNSHHLQQAQTASVVDYLYPHAQSAPSMVPTVTTLRPPIRVGIAFVPSKGYGSVLSEDAKQRLQGQIKAAFTQYPYIGNIEIIPSAYMRAGGGFANLAQVARMFNVDAVALLSYDQVHFEDSTALSVTY
jgi:rhombotail lipoprotein